MEKTEKELLLDSNSIIRSFYYIIQRKGLATNWEALSSRVEEILKEQQEYLYPTVKQLRKRKLNKINNVK